MRVLRPPLIGLLGPPAVIAGGIVTPISLQPKTLAVLAYVALAEQPVARRELAELFFADSADPRGSLRWHLTRLRGALPEEVAAHLAVTREAVELRLRSDAAVFRQSAEGCLSEFEPSSARAALALYRGAFLSGLAASGSPRFDSWLFLNEGALHTRFRRLALAYARWAIDEGRPHEALDPLSQLIELDPYVEDAHALRVVALAAGGAAEQARAAFDAYARVVREELHAEPRPDIAELVGRSAEAAGGLPREAFVTLSEVTLHVLDWAGGDPPILALHGAAMSGYVFSALAQRLAPAFRVVAPAIRGNGFSDKPPSGYTAERHVQDLVELIAALGLERPVIAGHSTGGAIAALLAERCQARGLILLDSVVGTAERIAECFAAADHILDRHTVPIFDVPAYLALMRRHSTYTPEAERLMERLVRMHLTRMPDGSYRGSVEPYAMRRTWASLVQADTIGALRRLDCPTLVVWARAVTPELRAEGPYLDERCIRDQLTAARCSELVIAERSNHRDLIRDPEPAVVSAIQRFLRATDDSAVATAARSGAESRR